MFSGSISAASGPVRPQSGNGGWFSGLSATSTDTSSNPSPRKRPLREMTLPNLTNAKEGSMNETDSRSVVGPQPVAAVASRLGVLGWFGSSSSINSGTGSISAAAERPVGDESKPQVEEVTVYRSQPECLVPTKEEVLLERERQVDSREKELEERKFVIDRRERELEDLNRGLEDRERVCKEGEEETRRKIEEVERRERELEERFEKEKEKWEEERSNSIKMSPPETWRNEMERLKQELNLEISNERKKAEERELELETRVIKKVTEILGLDKNSKVLGWKKR